MATIEEIFKTAENGTLTLEQFNENATKLNAKFADLSEGNYVSKRKYDDEIESLNGTIETLNGTIATRDTDLKDLQGKLEDAGNDATKIASLTADFDKLQNKYTQETNAYKEQLKTQAYEFAVKEFANNQKFSSIAAKRDFTRQMIDAHLKLDGDKILGASDFMDKYSKDNPDALPVSTDDDSAPNPETLPQFVASTGNPTTPDTANAFLNAFHFTGVRPIPTE